MGNDHSKGRQRSNSKVGSIASVNNSMVLRANSLDLIYIDDYFDDARYLKLVAKRLEEKQIKKNAEKNSQEKLSNSDTALTRKRGARTKGVKDTSSGSSARTTRALPASSKGPTPTTPPPSKIQSNKGTAFTRKTPKVSPSNSKKPLTSSKSVKLVPPPTKTFPTSSLSTGDIPPNSAGSDLSSESQKDKIVQTVSWHGEISSDNVVGSSSPKVIVGSENTNHIPKEKTGGTSHTTNTHLKNMHSGPNTPNVKRQSSSSSSRSSSASNTKPTEPNLTKKPRSILTSSKPQEKVSETVKRQRSYIIPSKNHQVRSPQRSHSVATDWHPSTTTPLPKNDSLSSSSSSSSSNRKQQPKKKLVVRGLKRFVHTHKREPSSLQGIDQYFAAGKGEGSRGSCPAIWKREFPSKGKFHPDNFIYDWAEGPKAPPRPLSAMAKCKKHGGKCNDCGLFTCDLCQSCRKCETDCACPCPVRGSTTTGGNPYTTAEVYQEVFGGDGWNRARKVLCNLTEQDKAHPVGGNASKRKTSSDENWAKNNLYKSQIDVLNPYNIPLIDAPPPGMQQPPLQHSMCIPPMFPMSFMPMMAMPPPMMPYYPPPFACPMYDPCLGPPQPSCPYPPSDSFMPVQNY